MVMEKNNNSEIALDLSKLSPAELGELINKVINDPSFEDTVQEVSLDDVKKMSKHLRELDFGWVRMMSERIGRDDRYIYNLNRGLILSNSARVEFLLQGGKLMKELNEQAKQAKKMLDEAEEEERYQALVKDDLVE